MPYGFWPFCGGIAFGMLIKNSRNSSALAGGPASPIFFAQSPR